MIVAGGWGRQAQVSRGACCVCVLFDGPALFDRRVDLLGARPWWRLKTKSCVGGCASAAEGRRGCDIAIVSCPSVHPLL
jgi:hypothetical protein